MNKFNLTTKISLFFNCFVTGFCVAFMTVRGVNKYLVYTLIISLVVTTIIIIVKDK